jgi:hypothetical protein
VYSDPLFIPHYRPPEPLLPWPRILAVTAVAAVALLVASSAVSLPPLERVGRVGVVESFAVASAWIADHYRGYVRWIRTNRVELERAGYWIGFLTVVGVIRSVASTFWAVVFFASAPLWLMM